MFLILDNLRVHNANVVKEWLAEHIDEIEVFYLPAYSRELNPDEYWNCDLPVGVHSHASARNNKQLKDKIISHMHMLQKKPARVAKHLHHPKINYVT